MVSIDSEYYYCNSEKIAIKDQDDAIITAFKTGRNIQNLVYSSPNLNFKSYKVYTGGTISGEETNGLYTTIESYTNGEEITFRDNNGPTYKKDNSSNAILIILLVESSLLLVALVVYCKKHWG